MSQRDLGARPIPEDPGRAVGEHVEAVGGFELTDDLVTEVEPDGPEHLADEGTQVLGDEEHEGNLVEDGRAGVLGDLDLWIRSARPNGSVRRFPVQHIMKEFRGRRRMDLRVLGSGSAPRR